MKIYKKMILKVMLFNTTHKKRRNTLIHSFLELDSLKKKVFEAFKFEKVGKEEEEKCQALATKRMKSWKKWAIFKAWKHHKLYDEVEEAKLEQAKLILA